MSHLTRQVDTSDGPIFLLEIAHNQLLSIDVRWERDIFSWTAACTVRDFLALGLHRGGTLKLTIGDERLKGEAADILSRVSKMSDEIINETCDFARFEWGDLSLMLQAFPTGSSGVRIHLVSAAGQGMQLAKLKPFITKTATDEVIKEVDSHLAASVLLELQRRTQPE